MHLPNNVINTMYNTITFINRAAMGRARFLLCTGFIIIFFFINRAAMGRARFMFYPWFIFFLFFINRAAMGRARFMFYPWFFFSVVFSATRPKLLSARLRMTQLCDVYSPEAVGTLIHGNRYGYCFLYCM